MQMTDKKLYSENQIILGSLFGIGWLGCYMMYRNFLTVNKRAAAISLLVIASIAFIALYVAEIFYDVMSMWLPIALVVMVFIVFAVTQREFVQAHKLHGGAFHSVKNVILNIVLFWVILWVISLLLISLYKPVITTLGFSEEVTSQSSNSVDTEQQVPVHSSEVVTEQTSSGAYEISSPQETNSDLKDFLNEEIGISFTYPEAWGTVEMRTDFGVASTSPEADPACLADENLASTIACTGALVGFVQDGEQFRPFLAVHGTYTEHAAQGEWWGLQAENQAEGVEVWSENTTLLGRPNTHLYRTESTGDMRVQYIIPQHDDISHIVVASPIAFGAVSSESRNAFQFHLQQISPPPEYSSDESWAEEYAAYQNEVERFDVSEDEEVQKYLQMLRSVALVN